MPDMLLNRTKLSLEAAFLAAQEVFSWLQGFMSSLPLDTVCIVGPRFGQGKLDSASEKPGSICCLDRFAETQKAYSMGVGCFVLWCVVLFFFSPPSSSFLL